MLGAAETAAGVTAWQYSGDGVAVRDHVGGGAPNAVADGSHDASTPRALYSYWRVGWNGDLFCRERRVTTDPDLAAAWNYALQRQFAGGNAEGNAAACPEGAVEALAAMPTPDELARDFWDVRILPAPTLTMAPDYAVTGKRVYLEITGEQRKHFDIPNPIGPAIGIDTTSRYIVDWGDGTVESTASQGGSWPDGDVTHVYTTSAPARTIRVQQQWSATWRAGDQQGALDNLQTSATLTFRVTQVQAVRS